MSKASVVTGALARLRTRFVRSLDVGALAAGTGGAILLGAALLATAIAFSLFNDPMRYRGIGGDEGYFVWCGWCITKGLAPYRDFVEFKPPIFFLTHALALKLYGLEGLQFRRFFAYFPLASLLALQASLAFRKVDKALALGLVLGLAHIWVNPKFHDTALSDSESIGLSFYFLGVAFMLAHGRWRAWTTGLGAAFLFCCIQSKEPFLPCVGCTWLACFFLIDRKRAWKAEARAYLLHSAIGAGVVLASLLIYMGPTGSLRAYIAIVQRYTVVYRDARQSFCAVGGVFQPTTAMNDQLRAWHRARAEYINTGMFGFLTPFGIASLLYTGRRSAALLALTLLGCVAAFLAVSASNCPWQHYYNMFLSGSFFFLVVGLVAMTPYLRAAEPRTRMLVRFAMLTTVALAIAPRIEADRIGYGTHVAPPLPAEQGGASMALIHAHTTPDDRIVTTGNPFIYVESDHLSALRESNLLDPIMNFYIGDTDVEKLKPLHDELVAHRPKLVILDPEFASAKVRHRDALWLPFLAEQNYQKLTEYVYVRPD